MPDPKVGYFAAKTVAILGYGLDAQDQAQLLRQNRIRVVIGLRAEDQAVEQARQDGFRVLTLWDAVAEGDVIQVW